MERKRVLHISQAQTQFACKIQQQYWRVGCKIPTTNDRSLYVHTECEHENFLF